MATYDTFSQIPTYGAATTASVVAAAGADIFFVIEGSSTKTVLVKKIIVSGPTLTTAAQNSIVSEKFSTAASGGTAVALTKVPLNSDWAAASATSVQVYTAAPTQGTLVGTVACRRLLLQATTADAGEVVFDYTDIDGGGLMLRGTTQGLGLAFGASPATAVTLGLEVQWQEL